LRRKAYLLAAVALQIEVAAVGLRETTRQAEAQACAPATLGGEEWFEHTRPHRLGNARAGIVHFEPHRNGLAMRAPIPMPSNNFSVVFDRL
jgi:hypothetical protein